MSLSIAYIVILLSGFHVLLREFFKTSFYLGPGIAPALQSGHRPQRQLHKHSSLLPSLWPGREMGTAYDGLQT